MNTDGGDQDLRDANIDNAPSSFRVVDSCEIEVPGPRGLVVFGATGDLTTRKLMPSLFLLFSKGMLGERFFVLGTGRKAMDDARFREVMRDAVRNAPAIPFDDDLWSRLAGRIFYVVFDYDEADAYERVLRARLQELERIHETKANRIFYLAVPPAVVPGVIENLGASGLAREEDGCSHVVVEKPFGRDLASARSLNRLLHRHFQESQIFRIDHYLAKETVQNILMLRFANAVFEPLWNQRYIDHVQITAAETIGIGSRAGYYEQAGVLRDMFQNHMFQLLCLTAMEPPSAFIADRVQDEKAKVLRSLRRIAPETLPGTLVIGQYHAGTIGTGEVPAYRQEPGIRPGSETPTFAALKVFIDNWRWHGVPFYLRSGKRLASRRTEISIHFKAVPFALFPDSVGGPIEPNTLVLRIQPDEGMSLLFQTKQPGSRVCLIPAEMAFAYPRGVLLDAYEWVLLDCMLGDHMLFMREDSVELAWAALTPVLEAVGDGRGPRLAFYPAGSDGPEASLQLFAQDGRQWRPL